MKILSSLVLLFIIFTAACTKTIDSVAVQSSNVSKVEGKRIYFKQQGNYVGSGFDYAPGDVFVLTADVDYTYFSLSDIHGTAQDPVTIINEGGVVHLLNGFNLEGCSYINITGTGTGQFYGFDISGHTSGDVGININGKSANIKVDHVDIHDKTYGYWVKQEVGATCDNSLYYPNWYMDSIEIAFDRVGNVNQEGMYLGSTGQNADRPNGCGQYPYPMRLSNIKVHDNIIDGTGRGGIQLSGADQGLNEIYNNKITRCGFEFSSYQGNGVVLGGNAHANIDNNIIKNTFSTGIWILGCGVTRVRNNIIDSSGWLEGQHADGMQGISFDARPSFPFVLSTFRIRNNTIGEHTEANDILIYNTKHLVDGIYISGFSVVGNLISNNNNGSAKISVQDGIIYETR